MMIIMMMILNYDVYGVDLMMMVMTFNHDIHDIIDLINELEKRKI